MSVPVTLNDSSTVCRTCLKVLDTTGFTYLDDESGYIKNVGNIREMLQFCVPELDLYVSSKPVICYQCLPILVQVYNFKIKSLNVESSIRAYITRNNLQEYNHVNLNCVLMEDLKIKSQKIQIENRIKHLMLQETGEPAQTNGNPLDTNQLEAPESQDESQDGNESDVNPMDIVETGTSETSEQETVERQMKIEIEESDEASLDYEGQSQGAYEVHDDEAYDAQNQETYEAQDQEFFEVQEQGSYEKETNEDGASRNNGNLLNEELEQEKQQTIVAVRKDLFGTKAMSEALPPSFILNKGLIAQNGRIVIKIDRKRLQTVAVSSSEAESTVKSSVSQPQAKIVVKPPPLAPLQTTAGQATVLKPVSNEVSEAQSSTEGTEISQQSYNCNKCPFVTHDVIKMYDHNRTYHSFDYTCQHCPFSTSKVELLGKHMTMVHPQNMMLQRNQSFKVSENYACSLCPFSVKSLDLLRSHHMAAHGTHEAKGPIVLNSAFGEEIARTEPKILKRLEYTCDVCPYSTRDKSNLRKHLFTHGTKPLKCDHCSYKCVSPYQLRRHQKQKHAKHADLKTRSPPYKLPNLQDKSEDRDDFKITLDIIKRELEKEITT